MLTAGSIQADERTMLGYGHLLSNDFLGDGEDRWRTGSFALSQFWGHSGLRTKAPGRPGELIEFRFRSEIIAPDNLLSASAFDRLYSGVLSIGAHTHFNSGIWEASVGVDLVAVGEQTGLSSFHRNAHKLIGEEEFGSVVEVDDGIYPTLLGEVGTTYHLGSDVLVRPFVEVQAGIETFVRAGVDLEFGKTCGSRIQARDVTTGHRYDGARCPSSNELGATIGLDVARVYESRYLPQRNGFELEDIRLRMRAGILYAGKHHSIFYGVTWLGREFSTQPSSQVVGTISLKLDL